MVECAIRCRSNLHLPENIYRDLGVEYERRSLNFIGKVAIIAVGRVL